MKTVVTAGLMALLPFLPMAQQTTSNETAAGKSALPALIAGSSALTDNAPKTARERRQVERQKVQFAKTQKAFSRNFENAADVRWSSGNSTHVAMFTNDGIKTVAWYSRGGALLYTLLSYEGDKLPNPERNLVAGAFHGYKITHVKEVHEGDVVVYVVHLENETTIKLVTVRDGDINVYRAYRKS